MVEFDPRVPQGIPQGVGQRVDVPGAVRSVEQHEVEIGLRPAVAAAQRADRRQGRARQSAPAGDRVPQLSERLLGQPGPLRARGLSQGRHGSPGLREAL